MRAFQPLRRFFSDTKGNIAILFGLAVVPVIGAMGVAFDYSLANASRTALQASLDNTGLILAKMMPLDDATLKSKGWEIFQANLGSSPLVYAQSDFQASQSTGKINLSISTTYNAQVGSVLKLVGGNPSFPVGTKTEVSWGNSRLRVALVLDNTYSMNEAGKLAALKTATTNLITQLQNVSQTNGDVYISIIPFSLTVNVGSSNYAASWIDWTDWDAANGSCSGGNGSTPSQCTTAHCSKSQYTTRTSCQNNSGTWYNAGTWNPHNHNTWNGCVADRSIAVGNNAAPGTAVGFDQKIDVPSATVPKWPANQDFACPESIMGLSYDWTALKAKVTAMDLSWSTNQPIGLVWGWQSLVGGGPLTAPALDPTYSYNQVIILMSDGLNTQNRWWGLTLPTDINVDRRMHYNNAGTISGTCKNIKDTGVIIYAVQVNTGGDATSTLMQNCATDATKFFELKTANELITTFDQIGSALANLHLSQ